MGVNYYGKSMEEGALWMDSAPPEGRNSLFIDNHYGILLQGGLGYCLHVTGDAQPDRGIDVQSDHASGSFVFGLYG